LGSELEKSVKSSIGKDSLRSMDARDFSEERVFLLEFSQKVIGPVF